MILHILILISLDRTVEDKTTKIKEKDNIKPDLRNTGCGFSKSVKQTIHFHVPVLILAALGYCY